MVRELAELTEAELNFNIEASNQIMARESIEASPTLATKARAPRVMRRASRRACVMRCASVCASRPPPRASRLAPLAERPWPSGLRRRLRPPPSQVMVPKVIPAFVTRRLLGMQYVDGLKIGDLAQDPNQKDAVKGVVVALIETFSYFMQGPIFNCDPHPGNLLVEKGTNKLVVLDWGQARRLNVEERIAHAQILMACAMEDSHLMMQACRALGFTFNADGGMQALSMCGVLRFLLRDSRPATVAKGDFGAMDRTLSRLSGDLKAIQGGMEKTFQGPLLPFSKTVNLLFEVPCRLNLSLPLLNMLLESGYAMLLKQSAERAAARGDLARSSTPQLKVVAGRFVLGLDPNRPIARPPPNPTLTSKAAQSMSAELERTLRREHSNAKLLGAQLCILDAVSGEVLADLAIGHTSYLEPAPIDASTVFNLHEISKVFLAAAVLRLVERRKLSLAQPLARASPPSSSAAGNGHAPQNGNPAANDHATNGNRSSTPSGKHGNGPTEQMKAQWADAVTLEKVLSHTAACNEFVPPYAAAAQPPHSRRTAVAQLPHTRPSRSLAHHIVPRGRPRTQARTSPRAHRR